MENILNDHIVRLVSQLNELLTNIEALQYHGKDVIQQKAEEIGIVAFDTIGVISSLLIDVPLMQPIFHEQFFVHARELTGYIKRIEKFAATNMFHLGLAHMPLSDAFSNYHVPYDPTIVNDDNEKIRERPVFTSAHSFFLLSLILRYLVIATLNHKYLQNMKLHFDTPIPLHDGSKLESVCDSLIVTSTTNEVTAVLKHLCKNYMKINLNSVEFEQLLDETLNRVALLMFVPHTRHLTKYIDTTDTVKENDVINPSTDWMDNVMCYALSLINEQLLDTVSLNWKSKTVEVSYQPEELELIRTLFLKRVKTCKITGKREQVLIERLLTHALPCDIFFRYYRRFGSVATNVDVLIAKCFDSSEIKELKKNALGSDIGLLNIDVLIEMYPPTTMAGMYIYSAILEDVMMPVFRNSALEENGFFGEYFIHQYTDLSLLRYECLLDTTPRLITCHDRFFMFFENVLVDLDNNMILGLLIFISYLQRSNWIAFKKNVHSIFSFDLSLVTQKSFKVNFV